MIKELRKMRAKGGLEKAKAGYIATLINRKKIPIHFSKQGYVAYDTTELKEYRATVKKGRPHKETKTKKENNNE